MPASDTPPSAFTDAIEIFDAPSDVFERRKLEPAFGLPLIILVLGIGILFFPSRWGMDPIFDAEFKRGFAQAMKQNPRYVFFAAFVGFFLWLAGKLVGAKEELAAACMVATFALYPRILERIVNALQALLLPEESLVGRYSVTLGLGRFFNPDTATPFAGAGRPYRCHHHLGDGPSRNGTVHHRQDLPKPGRDRRGTRMVAGSLAPRVNAPSAR